MIKLCSDFPDFYMRDAAFMHILCLKAAFSDSALEEDMWVQMEDEEICSVIARQGGRIYISSRGGNTDELKDFINTIGFAEIFTESSTAERLGLVTENGFTVLLKNSVKESVFSPLDIGIAPLYEGLRLGEDSDISLPAFEDFAADISHRLRHGAAVAVSDDRGAALAFVCEKGGIINGISVKKELRGKGFGSLMLQRLLSFCEGDILACTSQNNIDFYIKNGFDKVGTAVIAR